MGNYSKIFEPIQIGKLKLKNRTSMAPMGLVGYSDAWGGFNEEAQEYYIERARGGVGLIITGISFANYYEVPECAIPCASYNPTMFNMKTAPMVEKIHSYGAKIFFQVTGGLGRSAMPSFIKRALAPSKASNRFAPSIEHKELTGEEIRQLIADFVKSAVVAKQTGFDGIEIHAVHEGYLLDQFAISAFNKREDEFGGDLEGRLKIATDIVKGIKAACGSDFTVSLRYSVKSFMKGLRQGALPEEEFEEYGRDYEEGIEAAKILVSAGYDILNVDAGTYDSWFWNHPPMYFEDGMYREFGRMIKEAVDVPVILAGRLDDPEIALDALNGCCDIISYGRPLLADPYLVEKIRMGDLEDIRPCLSCHDGCMGRIAKGMPLSCAVNPACGREAKYGITKADREKSVLVIGGGPAGLEAARVAAVRGHKVTLAEASDRLGGNLNPGGVPHFKRYDHKLVNWYCLQMKKLGVEVLMNTKADGAFVREGSYDAVIMAAGSHPIVPDFGSANHQATATDVLEGRENTGDHVVIIGGGLVGCETALWLRQQGKEVTVVEMMPDILGGPHGMPFMNYDMLKNLLRFHGVHVLTSTKLTSVKEASVLVENESGTSEIQASDVVIAIGFRSNEDQRSEIEELPVPVYRIGDCRQVKNIMNAIWDAYEVAKNI